MPQPVPTLDIVRQRLAPLENALTDEQYQQMVLFMALLTKWNQVYNLTAIDTVDRIISHHLADSLSVVPYLSGIYRLLDVGSGAGIPGIPLAIARPNISITLLDASQKKTAFLRQAVIELALKNIKVVTVRAHEFVAPKGFDCIISRALTDLVKLVRWTNHLLTEKGYWLVMKGIYPTQEIEALGKTAQIDGVFPLSVVGVAAQRHLVKMLPIQYR